MEEIKTPRIIICNSKIFFEKELKSLDLKMFALISTLAFKKGYCFGSDIYLSKLINKTTRTVQRSLERLKKGKFIIIKIVNGKRRIYTYEEFAMIHNEKVYEVLEEYDWINE